MVARGGNERTKGALEGAIPLTTYFEAGGDSAFSGRGFAAGGFGLKYVTRQPPSAASTIPMKNWGFTELIPPAGGCCQMETSALTIGAPANTIDMTTGGVPLAPKASSTQN